MSQRPPNVMKKLLLLGSLIPLAAAIAGTARAIKHAADDTYVRRDSFALVHQRDSLVSDARSSRIETALGALVRACQRKRECP